MVILCPRVTMLHCAINLDAAVSVDASFNDTRCDGGMVCPNDPLLFTCTVTGSDNGLATVTLPSGDVVQINSDNTTVVVGGLPDGVTVYDHSAVVNSGVADYVLILMIDTASLLNDGMINCSDASLTPLTDGAACPVANGKTTVLLCKNYYACLTGSMLCKHAILLTISFGVREEGSEDECVSQQTSTATMRPGESAVFIVNVSALPLGHNQQYCYTVQDLDSDIEGGKSIPIIHYVS